MELSDQEAVEIARRALSKDCDLCRVSTEPYGTCHGCGRKWGSCRTEARVDALTQAVLAELDICHASEPTLAGLKDVIREHLEGGAG